MNTRINYKWAKEYDDSKPDNGFSCETDSIVTDGFYNFSDFLSDNGVMFEVDEKDEDFYFVVDDEGKRTGEVFMVISTEETD